MSPDNIFQITAQSSNNEITDAYHYGGFSINVLNKLTGKDSKELIKIIESGIVNEELADIGRRNEVINILNKL